MKRSLKPGLESLETREVPTVLGVPVVTPSALDLAQHFSASSPSVATVVIPPVPPIIPSPGQPLPIELARTRFHADFIGHYYNGPPHYTSQLGIFSMKGVGTSTQFLHGSVQMVIVFPIDPTANITGAAYLQDKNLVGSNAFALDFIIDRSSLDSRGRPTQGTFVADPNVYGGSNFSFQANGTIQIRYNKNNAVVSFDGRFYTNGITNVLGTTDLFARHGRSR